MGGAADMGEMRIVRRRRVGREVEAGHRDVEPVAHRLRLRAAGGNERQGGDWQSQGQMQGAHGCPPMKPRG
ncbi:hypothetical protein LNKW23_26250 [Paralimibaculum aggregatum]|uniref:Uncharacterized protein n=1 Tax=Paralimibaculum aggregatum TaxID=3036245 RepID=A0ABQ6LKA3_9RHOB|nr:hypothetical protein LNKW23_26250 [Limibaculum sp. NKW23]